MVASRLALVLSLAGRALDSRVPFEVSALVALAVRLATLVGLDCRLDLEPVLSGRMALCGGPARAALLRPVSGEGEANS